MSLFGNFLAKGFCKESQNDSWVFKTSGHEMTFSLIKTAIKNTVRHGLAIFQEIMGAEKCGQAGSAALRNPAYDCR